MKIVVQISLEGLVQTCSRSMEFGSLRWMGFWPLWGDWIKRDLLERHLQYFVQDETADVGLSLDGFEGQCVEHPFANEKSLSLKEGSLQLQRNVIAIASIFRIKKNHLNEKKFRKLSTWNSLCVKF